MDELATCELANYLRALEPCVWFLSADQARARRIAISVAEQTIERVVIVEWSLSRGVVFHRKTRNIEKYLKNGEGSADPYAFFSDVWKLVSGQGPSTTTYHENHYLVLLASVDYIIRGESQGPDPILTQLIHDLKSIESLRGSIILLGNAQPAMGVPQLLADIPRVVLGPPSPKEIQVSFLDHLIATGDIKQKEVTEVATSLFGVEAGTIQSVLCRALLNQSSESMAEFCRKERNRLLSASLEGVLKPVDARVELDDCPGVSPAFVRWIEIRKKHLGLRRSRLVTSQGLYLTSIAPGMGKSHIAQFVLNHLGAPIVFHLRLHSLLRKYLGEAESLLNKALNIVSSLAEQGIIVGIICDEADKFFQLSGMSGANDEGSSAVLNRVLAIMLQYISENTRPVFFVFAGNTLSIPPELLRAGRISSIACINPYSVKSQREILVYYLNQFKLEFNPDDLARAIPQNSVWSPAELRVAAENIYLEFSEQSTPVSLFYIRESLRSVTPIAELIGLENIEQAMIEAKKRNFLLVNNDSDEDNTKAEIESAESGQVIDLYRKKNGG